MNKVPKRLLAAIKTGREDTFYNSRTWRNKRAEVIEQFNNECQICKEEGKVTVGTKEEPLIAHHVKELKLHPELGLTDENLLAVCKFCHENKCHPDKFQKITPKVDIPERW